MSGVEVRRVETEHGETGVNVTNRVEVRYEIGAEIEGVWVAFGAISASKLAMLKTRADNLAARSPAPSPAPSRRARAA